jgi:PemK-like, MazF-like toxin of type II toxin-antitoxin system
VHHKRLGADSVAGMARRGIGEQIASIVGRAARDGARQWWRNRQRQQGQGRSGGAAGGQHEQDRGDSANGYPGDFRGTPDLAYAPNPDGRPDPGEIVWTWVPYEEDNGQGKDRPVLIVGRDDAWLLGLMLTSRDHDGDAAQETRHGRQWIDIGTGAWDKRGRPSEVRLDRVIRVDPDRVRREGAVLDEERFEQVASAVRAAG